MAIYINKHTDSLSIGRYKVLPGATLPEVALTEEEAACLVNFVEKGFLALLQPKPEPEPEPEPEPKKKKPRKHADG